ncbi:MAG: hypothetical protein HN392_09640 [Anaerolineae bacterium]|jgi:vancomycin resistance protein VanJ|nr:hypothetical protein [Anaerolineae bacterium]MBT7074085.1 hypothetical protein [Anaerolineae bacterium]
MQKKVSNLNFLVVLTHYYFITFFAWLILGPLLGDRWWWLFLLNSFSIYFFFLLPLPLIVAILTRKRSLAIGVSAIFIIGFFLYGELFLPSLAQIKKTGTQLTVMTFNTLGFNTESDGVIASVRASGANIVAFQELNPEIAAAIEDELLEEYPYQILDPKIGVIGMGLISQYPLEKREYRLKGRWVGDPQLLKVDWLGRKITVINFHAIPPGSILNFENLARTTKERNRQIQELLSFVKSREEPMVVLGDLNVSEHNDAYKILSAILQDAWRKKGWGFGHTFPGAVSPGSSRPAMAGIPLTPKWLIRLDYVFCSTQWQVESASLGEWDEVSDHRPVKATISLER